MFGNFKTYREYLDARIVALKQSAMPLPEDVRPWGGSLDPLETDRLRQYVASEGYGAIGTVEGGWAAGLADVSAELPAPPAGCMCDDCAGRMSVEQRFVREIAAKLAELGGIKGAMQNTGWAYCRQCGAWSRRAAEWRDRLCVTCASK